MRSPYDTTQRTNTTALAVVSEVASRRKALRNPALACCVTELSKITSCKGSDASASKKIHDSQPNLRVVQGAGPPIDSTARPTIPGDDLLSRYSHYHRPRMLNGRVREGNGCGHPGLLTGMLLVYQEGSGKSVPASAQGPGARRRPGRGSMRSSVRLLVPVS